MRKYFAYAYKLTAYGLLSLSFASYAAQAMTVEPLVLDLSTAGKATTQTLRVSNEGAAPLPVEIIVSSLDIGPNGQTSYRPAAKDFLIYPPQASIPAGGAQNFRIQWIGDPALKTSRNYRFSVAQIPIKQTKGTAGIQVSVNFGVIVGVSSPESTASMVVTDATLKTEGNKRVAAVQIKNPGSKYAYFRKAGLNLSGSGWSKKLTPEEVEQKIGLGIIQPGKERRFLIPLDIPTNVTQISATLDYRPEQ